MFCLFSVLLTKILQKRNFFAGIFKKILLDIKYLDIFHTFSLKVGFNLKNTFSIHAVVVSTAVKVCFFIKILFRDSYWALQGALNGRQANLFTLLNTRKIILIEFKTCFNKKWYETTAALSILSTITQAKVLFKLT